MDNKIYPCIWFDGKGKEAADLYISVFGDGRIIQDNGMVVNFELSGQQFICLNGGPQFKVNPSISFYVTVETEAETDRIWNRLLEGGSVLMPIDKYDWSPRYGWLQDKFGVNWQISAGKISDTGQKFCPTLMFVKQQQGRAEEALKFYTSLFPNSSVRGILYYSEKDGDTPGTVKHAQFKIGDYVLMAMDSGLDHQFRFSEGLSLVVQCEDQAEIDRYWNTLSSDGGQESMCGWLKDRFGVSWQIIPRQLSRLMGDPEKGKRVMAELMKMKKIDLKTLENA